MMQTTLIAIALGLIAAIAFLSSTAGPLPARLLFSLITPLPILLAGLGWGVRAGGMAALAGGGILVVLLPSAGGLFLTTAGLPAAILAYLAQLNRSVDANETAPREWYPAGRLVIWAAALAAIPAIIWALLLEANGPEQKTKLITMLSDALTAAEIKHSTTGLPLSADDIAMLTSLVYAALPAALSIAWMTALLLTLWLSGRIMQSSGQLVRPWPDLSQIEFPTGAALALVVALGLSILDGVAGLASRAVAGTLMLAFMLLGLAVIHNLTKGWQWRSFVLGMIYGGLIVISLVIAVPLTLLGLSEGIFNFRSRFRPPPQGST
jgi:Predicted membrane protein (DUF2232)